MRKILGKLRRIQSSGFDPCVVRPFQVKELKPVPAGWELNGPAFVGIGSQKAGTSWWYSLILSHPKVVRNRLSVKELSYFFHFGHHGPTASQLETYRQAFAAPAGSISGEWSPGYLTHPFAVDYLAMAAPKTKVLVIVRNPVDRFLSGLNQEMSVRLKRLKLRGARQEVYRDYSLFPAAIRNSLIGEGMRNALKVFDRSQVLLLQYERCKAQPIVELAKTYRFLGLDETFVPAKLASKVNIHPYLVPELKPEERLRLARCFADDVGELCAMFPEIDLSLWPDFSSGGRGSVRA